MTDQPTPDPDPDDAVPDPTAVEPLQGPPPFVFLDPSMLPGPLGQILRRISGVAASPDLEQPAEPVPVEPKLRAAVMMDLVEDMSAVNRIILEHGKVLEELGIGPELRAQLLGNLTAMIVHGVIVHR